MNKLEIAKGLIDIALNKNYNEKVLREALLLDELDKYDKNVIKSFINGTPTLRSSWLLQDIGNKILNNLSGK